MRVKIVLQYNGTSFMGSQTQTTTANTVMGVLHHAMQRLGINAVPVASGRTDRGVHATGQTVHCDLPPHWEEYKDLRHSLNRHLPPTIRIRSLTPVSDAFHARFSAKRRVYRYLLSESEPNPFEWDFVTFSPPLDTGVLNAAMKTFLGTHDFSRFKKSGSETKNDVRTIYRAFAYRHGGRVVLTFEGNGFLRSQIRMMVGFLLEVNAGRRTVQELAEQLACRSDFRVKPAPHNGLYLAKIKY